MSSPRTGSVPLGVKIAAAWAVITGVALLVLGIARTPVYVPLGLMLLVGAYGLSTLQTWGLVLVALAFAIEGVRDVTEGAIVELVVVLVVLAYLFSQRRHFSGLSRPLDSG